MLFEGFGREKKKFTTSEKMGKGHSLEMMLSLF